MNPMESARGRAVVVQPDEGRSWWQPMPANGHADPKLVPAETGFGTLSMGYQTIAPGSRIRPHSHGEQVELQICFRAGGPRSRTGSVTLSSRVPPASSART